jgi:TonB family protein
MSNLFLKLSFIGFLFLDMMLSNRVLAQEGTSNADTSSGIQIDIMAEYPGGEDSIMAYIANNTRYPLSALEDNIQGRVLVSFVVDTGGRVINVKVVESVRADLDSEAIRVISGLKTFKPATRNGKEVSIGYRIPVNFKIVEGDGGILMYVLKLILGSFGVVAVGLLANKYMKKNSI